MVLLYMLILSMVSLPTILPKHLLVETADKGGDDYSRPRPTPSFFPPHDYSMGQQNEGQDYDRLTGPDWPNPRPEPSPSPSPWFNPPVTGAGPGGPGGCMDRCLKAGKLH